MAFIDNLETVLGIRGISPAELCRAVNIANSSMSMWAKGSIPKADTAYNVAEFLGVTVEYLLTGKLPGPQSFDSLVQAKVDSVLESDVLDLAKRIDALPDDMKDIVLATLEACERHKS